MSDWAFILATPDGGDLSYLLWIGALVLFSLLRNIFGKKQQQAPKEGPTLRRPPPRTPQPTHRVPPPPTQRPPVARPTPRRVEPPVLIQAPPPARRLSREEIRRHQRGEQPPRAVPEAIVEKEPPKPIEEPVALARKSVKPAPPTAAVTDKLALLMRDRTALQAGLVLSEILGPPVALRDRPAR